MHTIHSKSWILTFNIIDYFMIIIVNDVVIIQSLASEAFHQDHGVEKLRFCGN